MATSPQYQDVSSDFNSQYTNPDTRFGVQNARASRGNREQTLTSRPTEDGRRGRTTSRRYRGPQESTDFVEKVSRREQILDERYYVDSREQMQEAANLDSDPKKAKVHTSALTRARGVTFGIATMSWLVPVFFFWQIPMAMMGAIMLGMAMQIEADSLLATIDGLAQSFGSLFGYEYFDVAGLGMLAVISAAVFGVISACIAGFTAVLWGLHPLSGNAAGTKKVTFLVGVVGACLPFANMFPWIIFWILVMMRHPK